jgi:hypothetical protein
MAAVLFASGLAAWKGGLLRCFAASWVSSWLAFALGYGRFVACARLMPQRNSREKSKDIGQRVDHRTMACSLIHHYNRSLSSGVA